MLIEFSTKVLQQQIEIEIFFAIHDLDCVDKTIATSSKVMICRLVKEQPQMSHVKTTVECLP